MSHVTIHINLDNEAFSGEDCAPELARVLQTLAHNIRSHSRGELEGFGYRPRDSNGNSVGHVDFEIDEEEGDEEDE